MIALDFKAVFFYCTAGAAEVLEGFEELFEAFVAEFEWANDRYSFAASAFAGGLDAEVMVFGGEFFDGPF